MGSIEIGLGSLKINYEYGAAMSIIDELQKLNNNQNIKTKLLIKMGEKCDAVNPKFSNNLSVLICNIFFMNLKRGNTLIKDPKKGFTL